VLTGVLHNLRLQLAADAPRTGAAQAPSKSRHYHGISFLSASLGPLYQLGCAASAVHTCVVMLCMFISMWWVTLSSLWSCQLAASILARSSA